MLLDTVLPAYDVAEVHSVSVRASPERVFRAVHGVTPAEVPEFRLLMWMRALPSQVLARRRFRFMHHTPVLDQFLRAGFTVLAEERDHELVVGRIGQFWRLVRGSAVDVTTGREFVDFQQPGYAKAALNFSVQPEGDRTRLRTETRVRATDPRSRTRFFRYWLLVGPGSGLIRRSWLRAIQRRAERAEAVGG